MALPKINETARLAAPPELRYTNNGRAVCSLRLVFSKRKLNRQTNQWEDAGELWVNGTAWEQLGENIAESGLDKGSEVLVSGELSQREYERKDGSKGTSLELNIYAIGPSLRSATATVNKASRGGQGGPSGQQDDPWAGGAADDGTPF